jgi:uncharacterized membrane protein YuzA (DUF378 family)
MPYKALHIVAFIFLIIGGLNWLAVGLGYNVVEMILGKESVVSHVIYILVGIAAIYEVLMHKSNCRMCTAEIKK